MGLFSKPKAPEQSPEQKAAERRLRRENDELTEAENRRLKFAKRGQSGRRSLLSGDFISGSTGQPALIRPRGPRGGSPAGGGASRAGGILSRASAPTAGRLP